MHRSPHFSVQILRYFGALGLDAPRSWKHLVARQLRPHISSAVYQNCMDRDLRGWQRAYYGSHLTRLREIKARVDPEQLLRFPQRIAPACG